MKGRVWHWLRWSTQVLALVLFLYLLLGTRRESATVLPHDLFFRLDPLAGISAMLASRAWLASLALSGVVLVMAVVAGRAWCGWLCPLGTILDWTPARRPAGKGFPVAAYWREVKHFVLFIVLFAAVLGSLTLLILDPITLLFRTVAAFLLPAFSLVVTQIETWLYGIIPLRSAIEWVDAVLRPSVLTEQPFFWPNLAVGAVFASVLALNAVEARFWCRYLCPLGALLGLVSKVAQVRHEVDEAKCTACRRCAALCPTGAIEPERRFMASPVECTVCLDCLEVCPTHAITFRGQWGWLTQQHYDPSRRQFLFSLSAGVVGALLLRTASLFHQPNPGFVRPPGTSDERLLSSCLRCGECVRVCPTGGLQPASSASGWEGLWTPALVPRLGYCDYSCHSCGQVCPTGAIPELSLADKREQIIGVASIDKERCIPWAEGRDCVVCEEMCPVSQKAILLKEETVVNFRGERTTVLCPRVRTNLCIGCGICEYQCPVAGEAAIRILTPGDIRSEAGGSGLESRRQLLSV